MAQIKKNGRPLAGENVEVFLQTPLFRFKYKIENQEHELMENAVRVSGLVLEELSGGLAISVKALSNLKTEEKNLPFEDVFIPYGKIDFIVYK